MTTVFAYAAPSASGELGPFSYEPRDLRNDDVEIKILYCGVCHTDLHKCRNHWGGSQYPLVPGHEIVGKVARVGTSVTKYKLGDVAAVGCLVDSCGNCRSCKDGLENYCENAPTLTYDADDRKDGKRLYGGYSESITVRESFVLRVPSGLDVKSAAPLLCAGITMWSPLRNWKVNSKSKVAVAGLGGLGHMGIKLAKGLGAHVTLLSRSPGKATDGRRLGADEVLITTDEAAVAGASNQFDIILDTVPYDHDVNPYLSLLRRDGNLVLLGLIGNIQATPLNTGPMLSARRSVSGSGIGGIQETQELLDFCAAKKILPDVEMIAIQEINDAYERLIKGDVKYRFVIEIESLSKVKE